MTSLSLALRNVLFTLVVPGGAGGYIPWWILTSGGRAPRPIVWPAAIVIAVGFALYLWCLWNFATVGRGTPGPWDPPRHLVATGPYRYVRNPIYLAVSLVIAGEALLFVSAPLVVYLVLWFFFVSVFVLAYEEPALSGQFGEAYEAYRRSVPRWIPRMPPR